MCVIGCNNCMQLPIVTRFETCLSPQRQNADWSKDYESLLHDIASSRNGRSAMNADMAVKGTASSLAPTKRDQLETPRQFLQYGASSGEIWQYMYNEVHSHSKDATLCLFSEQAFD